MLLILRCIYDDLQMLLFRLKFLRIQIKTRPWRRQGANCTVLQGITFVGWEVLRRETDQGLHIFWKTQ